MGAVYEAHHKHLDKPFAVKVVLAGDGADQSATRRLLREARAAAAVQHPGIVPVVHADITPEGELFLVMELVRGESLAELLAREGALAPERALRIAAQVAHALAAAHAEGLVHRDVKPANVLVENVVDARGHAEERARLTDFGIVKRVAGDHETTTTAGVVAMGTPQYMAPEQARGEEIITGQADQYAATAMLFEMLTGAPLFGGGNVLQLIYKHANEPPPALPASLAASLPKGAETFFARGLHKDPAERFERTSEMAAAIDAIADAMAKADDDAALASLAPREGTSRVAWVLAGVAALALLAGLVAARPGAAPARLETAPATSAAAATAATSPAGADTPSPPLDEAATSAPAREGGSTPSHPLGSQAGADAEAPASEPPSPAVETVRLPLVSTPAGALVRLGDERLGVTPFDAEIPRTEDEIALRFTRRGYAPAVRRVVPDADREVRARLTRVSPAGGIVPIWR